jgi:hypothetical protein
MTAPSALQEPRTDTGLLGAATPSRHADAIRAGLAFVGLGLVLAAVFFPFLFDSVTASYDDEGYFLTTVGQFLHHGSLYVHTSGTSYGPFYWSFLALIYRLSAQSPTPTTGRLLVLGFTVASSALFAGAVWRVTRDLLMSIVCQVVTFCILISVAGAEPISPGSTIALLLSVLVFALAGYSVTQSNVSLVFAGIAVGALALTKINIGILALVGLAAGLVVGNSSWPRPLRGVVAAGAILLPFVLMFQRLSLAGVATWAFIVAISMLGTCIILSADVVSLRPSALRPAAYGLAGVVLVSVLWPLSTGTSLGAMAAAVLVRPLHQVNLLTAFPVVQIEWLSLLVTGLVVAVAIWPHRSQDEGVLSPTSRVPWAALAVAGVVVLVLAVDSLNYLWDFGIWLPAIVLVPALALIADVEPSTRLALRLVVPIAILQDLQAYPVAGSQREWSTVAVIVPCAIAVSAGLKGLPLWREAPIAFRAGAVAVICVFSVFALNLWPVNGWVTYHDNVALGLPGTALIRVSPAQAAEYRQLASVIERNCDTFYSAPPMDTLYIYTGIPAPTGQLANWAGMLTTSEEQDASTALQHLQSAGKRVCVVRNLSGVNSDEWTAGGSEANLPIGKFIGSYQRVIAKVGGAAPYPSAYTVSVRGAGS